MRPTHYLAITVRLFSICLLFFGIRQSPLFIELISGGTSGPALSWLLATALTVFPIIVAIFLWVFPMMVASTMIKSEINLPITPIDVQSGLTVLILVLALYTLYNAVIDTVYWTTLWQISERSLGLGSAIYLNPESKANMVATGVELSVSVLLISKARRIAMYMLRIPE